MDEKQTSESAQSPGQWVGQLVAAVILAEPTIFYSDGLRLGGRLRLRQEHLLQLGEPLGKIGQELGSQFALVAARTKDVRDGDEARIFSHS